MTGLARLLAAPAATWRREVDVVVLGSGAAGLAAALAARPARSVLVVTKDVLDAGSTAWAQGGLAGVLDPLDSLEDHVRDTLAAGAGLCDVDQAVWPDDHAARRDQVTDDHRPGARAGCAILRLRACGERAEYGQRAHRDEYKSVLHALTPSSSN